MRVYEYSKLSGIPSKELLEALAGAGFEAKSHMAVLTQSELDFLRKTFEEGKKMPEVIAPRDAGPIIKPKVMEPVHPPRDLERKQIMPSASTQEPNPIVFVVRPMLVSEAAQGLHQPAAAVILTLLRWGVVAAKNQLINEDIVTRLAEHYDVKVVKPVGKEQTTTSGILVEKGEFKERPPVVVVVGHVDHGKTTLLDYIRKTRVASREKGGITQHLGAYEASTPHGNIVFIDTPGHEAFSRMRARGIGLADVVVLVIAADDSIMPQTIEAIKHIKAMGVPVVVAVNKMDRVEKTRLETVKRDLAQHDLLPEEWGGQTVLVPISAKTGMGVDQLLEMILLQSQLLELKADVSGPAKGYVLEASLEKGRGPVATVIAQHGHITIGDFFSCGTTSGKVNSLIDSHGERVTSAGPSIPVRVAGFSELPEPGDYFEVVEKDAYRKTRVASEVQRAAVPAAAYVRENAINIIVKTDNNSSKEALVEAIHKISKKYEKEKPFAIVHTAVGDITESDVNLAAASGASIIGLHIKAGSAVTQLARRLDVTIELHDIIYKLLERLQEIAEASKAKKIVRTKIGEAEVRRVFDIKGQGVVAGCYVKDGRFSKDGIVVVWRGRTKIGEGKIKSLQRDRKVVKEVNAGYECAFVIDGIQDWAEGDRVECYTETKE